MCTGYTVKFVCTLYDRKKLEALIPIFVIKKSGRGCMAIFTNKLVVVHTLLQIKALKFIKSFKLSPI